MIAVVVAPGLAASEMGPQDPDRVFPSVFAPGTVTRIYRRADENGENREDPAGAP
jgi:hypothetical protein